MLVIYRELFLTAYKLEKEETKELELVIKLLEFFSKYLCKEPEM